MSRTEFKKAIMENRVKHSETGEVLPIAQLIRSNPFLETSIVNGLYKDYEEGVVYID